MNLNEALCLDNYVAWLRQQDNTIPVGYIRSYDSDPFNEYIFQVYGIGGTEVLDDDYSLRINGEWVEMPEWLVDLVVALDRRLPGNVRAVYPQEVLEIINGMATDNTQTFQGKNRKL